jgi:hypothetical protein
LILSQEKWIIGAADLISLYLSLSIFEFIALVGYARVNSTGQSLEVQLDKLIGIWKSRVTIKLKMS